MAPPSGAASSVEFDRSVAVPAGQFDRLDHEVQVLEGDDAAGLEPSRQELAGLELAGLQEAQQPPAAGIPLHDAEEGGRVGELARQRLFVDRERFTQSLFNSLPD